MLEGPLDQSMYLTDNNRKAFDEVDKIIGRSITAGDPIIALEYGRELLAQSQVQGLALAKLLYKLRESWSLFEAAGVGDSLEAMANVHMGRSSQTVTKYIRLWENVFANESIPTEIRQALMGRPVKDLLLITALAREGTDEETFKKIAAASDHNAVRDIVQGERGSRTSGRNAVRIYLETRFGVDSKPGTLSASQGDTKTIIGTLEIEQTDELSRKAISRIVQAAGIIERTH